MDRDGLRQTKLEGGWTAHKTQEDGEKKMRGQNGGELQQMVKAGWREREETLKSCWQHMHHQSNSKEGRLDT